MYNREVTLYSYPSKFSKNKIKVLLYYPNTYYIGMSNLGFQTIFHILKTIPDIYCERGFYPDLSSFETKTPLKKFDLIIFSISFEIDFINIIEILLKTEIEIFSEKRNTPFLAAGGIAITLNPYLYKNVFDVQFIGEGEELIKEFINEFLANKNFSKIKGIFTKYDNFPDRRVYYKDDLVSHSVIITPETIFSNSLLIEIARGCLFACNFCAVSYNYKPFRPRNKEKILSIITMHKDNYQKIGLISSNVCSHPDFFEIGECILKLNKKFSISSLRLDTLKEETIDLLKKANNNTFTVAIETGSEKLRKKINKKLTDKQIFNAIELFIKKKVLNLKFYFLVGLPEEEFEDIIEIVNIIKKFKSIYHKNRNYLKHFGKFTISINPFIPKRNTPFFNYKIEDITSLMQKYSFLKKELKKIPNVELIFENIYSAYLQYYLSTQNENFVNELIDKVKYGLSNKKFIDKINEIYY